MIFLDTCIYLRCPGPVQRSVLHRDAGAGNLHVKCKDLLLPERRAAGCTARFSVPKSLVPALGMFGFVSAGGFCISLLGSLGWAASFGPCSVWEWVLLSRIETSGALRWFLGPPALSLCSWAAQGLFGEGLVSGCCLCVFKNESQSKYISLLCY